MQDDSQNLNPLPNSPPELRSTLLSYLCGALPQADSDRFEQLLLEDDEISQQIASLEEEILEEFALGGLSSSEQHALGPWVEVSAQRREHVRLTRVLHKAALTYAARLRPWIRWVAVAAVLAAAVTLSLLWRQPAVRLSKSVPAASSPALSSSPASKPADALNAPPQLQASIVLLRVERLRAAIAGSRGAQADVSTYPVRDGAPVRIQILLPAFVSQPSGQMSFNLTIRPIDANGASAVRRDGLTPQQVGGSFYLDATLPAGSIPTGRYIARVSYDDGEFAAHFRVVAQK